MLLKRCRCKSVNAVSLAPWRTLRGAIYGRCWRQICDAGEQASGSARKASPTRPAYIEPSSGPLSDLNATFHWITLNDWPAPLV